MVVGKSPAMPSASNKDVEVSGFSEKPATTAPIDSSQRQAQPPVKPVLPVTRILLPVNAFSKFSLLFITIISSCSTDAFFKRATTLQLNVAYLMHHAILLDRGRVGVVRFVSAANMAHHDSQIDYEAMS